MDLRRRSPFLYLTNTFINHLYLLKSIGYFHQEVEEILKQAKKAPWISPASVRSDSINLRIILRTRHPQRLSSKR